jgi:hypothetical protein
MVGSECRFFYVRLFHANLVVTGMEIQFRKILGPM